jgi:hypothetical protein
MSTVNKSNDQRSKPSDERGACYNMQRAWRPLSAHFFALVFNLKDPRKDPKHDQSQPTK